jgi:hypothetical protein
MLLFFSLFTKRWFLDPPALNPLVLLPTSIFPNHSSQRNVGGAITSHFLFLLERLIILFPLFSGSTHDFGDTEVQRIKQSCGHRWFRLPFLGTHIVWDAFLGKT